MAIQYFNSVERCTAFQHKTKYVTMKFTGIFMRDPL